MISKGIGPQTRRTPTSISFAKGSVETAGSFVLVPTRARLLGHRLVDWSDTGFGLIVLMKLLDSILFVCNVLDSVQLPRCRPGDTGHFGAPYEPRRPAPASLNELPTSLLFQFPKEIDDLATLEFMPFAPEPNQDSVYFCFRLVSFSASCMVKKGLGDEVLMIKLAQRLDIRRIGVHLEFSETTVPPNCNFANLLAVAVAEFIT